MFNVYSISFDCVWLSDCEPAGLQDLLLCEDIPRGTEGAGGHTTVGRPAQPLKVTPTFQLCSSEILDTKQSL